MNGTASHAALTLIGAAHETIGGLRAEAPRLARWAELIAGRRRGGMVLTAGNGGSATTPPTLPVSSWDGSATIGGRCAVCLTSDGSTLTAVGNDYGFERVFARQIEGLAGRDDVVVLFSTSGRSPNLLRRSARRASEAPVRLLSPAAPTCCSGSPTTRQVDGADTVDPGRPSRWPARIVRRFGSRGWVWCTSPRR